MILIPKGKHDGGLVAKSCPTLVTPWTVCSPPDSPVHQIFQARILEWVAISFSRASPRPRIGPRSPALQADSLPTELEGKTSCIYYLKKCYSGKDVVYGAVFGMCRFLSQTTEVIRKAPSLRLGLALAPGNRLRNVT